MKKVLMGAAGAGVVLVLGLVGYKVLHGSSSQHMATPAIVPQTGVVAYQPAPAPAPTPAPVTALPSWVNTASGLLNFAGQAFNTTLGVVKSFNP